MQLSERARAVVRLCWCGHEIVPESWYPDVPPEQDSRLTWVHVETGRRTHYKICPSIIYAHPAEQRPAETSAAAGTE